MAVKKKKGKTIKQSCFVVGPIGEAGSDIRDKADWLLYIIRPVLEEFGYNVTRADEISEPGLITDQVITEVTDADLVVADLSGHNPNAFYELAIRHHGGKPVIHIIERGEPLPFDVSDFRAIYYSFQNPKDIKATQEELRTQIQAIKAPNYRVSNPITRAIGHKELALSGDPRDELIADYRNTLQNVEKRLERLENTTLRTVPAGATWATSANTLPSGGLSISPDNFSRITPPFGTATTSRFGTATSSGHETNEEMYRGMLEAIIAREKLKSGLGKNKRTSDEKPKSQTKKPKGK